MAWAKGTSGNPSGRRPDAIIGKARARIGRHLIPIIDQLVTQALAGDTAAAKIIVDRILPTVKQDYELLEARIQALESKEQP